MANVVVVGAQWGDEGKGKIVDWLSIEADIVVRFQGGHNAGHTLVIGDKTFNEAAKARHPERWTGQTRDWSLINEVWLNPEKSQVEDKTESNTTAS